MLAQDRTLLSPEKSTRVVVVCARMPNLCRTDGNELEEPIHIDDEDVPLEIFHVEQNAVRAGEAIIRRF